VIGFWIALAVFLLSAGAGLAFAVGRGLSAWRQIKATRALIGAELDRIATGASEIERHLAAAGASQAKLQDALARLGSSRGGLLVQQSAIAEAQWVVRRLLPFLPR
jgi:hypothetical protein